MPVFIGLSDFQEIWKPGKITRLPPIASEPIHKEILRQAGKKHPKALYIPTAVNDSEDTIDFFRKYYLSLGYKEVDALCLLKNPPPAEEIASKIASADVIYVNGGNTHRMIATWKRLGVDKLLQQAHLNGTIMSGHSAGLVCWFRYGCSNSFYTDRPFRLTGMGVIDAVVCPHYDSEPFRQPALKKIMKRTPALIAIALEENTALEIINGNYRFLATTPAAKVRRAYWENGDYVIEEIPAAREFRSLKQLLTKPA